MTGERPTGRPWPALAAFAALAGFSAFHWANLLVDPPVARVAATVVIAVATALALGGLTLGRQRGRATAGLAALVALAGIAAGLVAAGIPARLLAPGNWDELREGLRDGVTSLGGATYPYRAGGEWPRLALLSALPVVLGLAAATAFWPRGGRGPRAIALALLVGLYGVAAVLYAPGHPALHGAILLALVAAWLWWERLREPRAARAAGLVVAAGVLALPLSSAIARSEPVVNYRSWSWTGGEPAVSFDWNHSYEPLDWPREGTPLLEIESDVPHYWRSVVLERFDGFRWVRSNAAGSSLELPNKVEGQYNPAHEDWLETIRVTVRELRSGLVVGPGSVQSIEGLTGSIAPDGTVFAGEIPNSGQSYTVTSYAPDPSAGQLEAADGPYPPAISRYTTLELPTSKAGLPGLGAPEPEVPGAPPLATEPVEVPLRGNPAGRAHQQIRRSGYGGVQRLARQLVNGAPTGYDAVRAVEQHFQEGFTYSEEPAAGGRPLRSFLLETRTGYCQQYSGAMALMLRMVGIPARVVSGFSPGERDEDGSFTVRDYDAHSWVEVYFTGIGWVPFDPTPTAAPASLQSNPDAAAATPGRTADAPRGQPRESDASPGALGGSAAGGGDFPWAVLPALLAATALGAAVATGRRRARFSSAPQATRVEAQVRELAAAARATRYLTEGRTTLLELERRLRAGGREKTAAYAARLRANLYGRSPGRHPDLRERRDVRRELARSRGLRERLRMLAALPPGGPRIT